MANDRNQRTIQICTRRSKCIFDLTAKVVTWLKGNYCGHTCLSQLAITATFKVWTPFHQEMSPRNAFYIPDTNSVDQTQEIQTREISINNKHLHKQDGNHEPECSHVVLRETCYKDLAHIKCRFFFRHSMLIRGSSSDRQHDSVNFLRRNKFEN